MIWPSPEGGRTKQSRHPLAITARISYPIAGPPSTLDSLDVGALHYRRTSSSDLIHGIVISRECNRTLVMRGEGRGVSGINHSHELHLTIHHEVLCPC